MAFQSCNSFLVDMRLDTIFGNLIQHSVDKVIHDCLDNELVRKFCHSKRGKLDNVELVQHHNRHHLYHSNTMHDSTNEHDRVYSLPHIYNLEWFQRCDVDISNDRYPNKSKEKQIIFIVQKDCLEKL